MSRWFRIDSALAFSLEAQKLSAREFREAFTGAVEGGDTVLSRFIRGPYTRPLANEWKAIRERIFKRDDYTCSYCGVRGVSLECDHVVPVARGGLHDDANLTTACKPCNRSKRSKLVSEWKK